MDAEGMSATALEELLANWDESARGAKRYVISRGPRCAWRMIVVLTCALALMLCTPYPLARIHAA